MITGIAFDRQERPQSQRRFSVDEYHRMIAAGILGEDEPVELLEGLIVDMPQNPAHARVVQRLTSLLVRALAPDRFAVRVQLPLTFEFQKSEPEPDLAVVRAEDAQSLERHPSTALLVIEVATTSLHVDRTLKGAIYARANVPEYWVVDVDAALVEVYRDPEPGAARYRSLSSVRGTEVVDARTLPDLTVPVATLFA